MARTDWKREVKIPPDRDCAENKPSLEAQGHVGLCSFWTDNKLSCPPVLWSGSFSVLQKKPLLFIEQLRGFKIIW